MRRKSFTSLSLVLGGFILFAVLFWAFPHITRAEGAMNRDEAVAFYTNLLQDARIAAYGSVGRATIQAALTAARSGNVSAYDEHAEEDRPSITPPVETASAPSAAPATPVPIAVPQPTLNVEVTGATPAAVGTGTWNTQSGQQVSVRIQATQSDRISYDVGCTNGVKVFVGGRGGGEKQCIGEQTLSATGDAITIQTEYICNNCTARDVLIQFSAQNSAYRVNRSIVLSVSPQAPPPPPPPPTPVAPTARLDSNSIAMDDNASFSWTRAENADTCTLFVNGVRKGAVSCGGSAEPVVFSGADLSGGMPGSFSAYIQTCNRAGNCASSNTVSLTVRAPVARPRRAPTVSVNPREITPEQTAVFTWTAAAEDVTECFLAVNNLYNPLSSCAGGRQEFTGRRLAELLHVAANLDQSIPVLARINICNSAGCTQSNLAELLIRPAQQAVDVEMPPLVLPAPPAVSEAPIGQASFGPDVITPNTLTTIATLTWQPEAGVVVSAYYDCMDGVDSAHLTMNDAYLYMASAPYYYIDSDGERQPNAIPCGENNAVSLNNENFFTDGRWQVNLIGANESGADKRTTIHVLFRRGSNVARHQFSLLIRPAPSAAERARQTTLAVSVDESSPALREEPAGTRDVELLRLRVSGTASPIALRQIALRASEESNLDALVGRRVTIWHSGNQIGTAEFAQGEITAMATISDIEIPQDGFVILAVRGSILSIASDNQKIVGASVSINYDGARVGTEGTRGSDSRGGEISASSPTTNAPGVLVRIPTPEERAAALEGSTVILQQQAAEGASTIGGINFRLSAPQLWSRNTISCTAGESCIVRMHIRLTKISAVLGGDMVDTSAKRPFLHMFMNGVSIQAPIDLSSFRDTDTLLSLTLFLPQGKESGAHRVDIAVLPFGERLDIADISIIGQQFTGASAILSISVAGEAVELPSGDAQNIVKLARQASTIAVTPREFTIITDPTLPFDVFGEGIGAPTVTTSLGVEMRTFTVALAPGERGTTTLRWSAAVGGNCRLYSSDNFDLRGLPLAGTRGLIFTGSPVSRLVTYTLQCGNQSEVRARSLVLRIEPPRQQPNAAPVATTTSGVPFPESTPPPPPPFPFCNPEITDRCVPAGVPTTTPELLPGTTAGTGTSTGRATSSLPRFDVREE